MTSEAIRKSPITPVYGRSEGRAGRPTRGSQDRRLDHPSDVDAYTVWQGVAERHLGFRFESPGMTALQGFIQRAQGKRLTDAETRSIAIGCLLGVGGAFSARCAPLVGLEVGAYLASHPAAPVTLWSGGTLAMALVDTPHLATTLRLPHIQAMTQVSLVGTSEASLCATHEPAPEVGPRNIWRDLSLSFLRHGLAVHRPGMDHNVECILGVSAPHKQSIDAFLRKTIVVRDELPFLAAKFPHTTVHLRMVFDTGLPANAGALARHIKTTLRRSGVTTPTLAISFHSASSWFDAKSQGLDPRWADGLAHMRRMGKLPAKTVDTGSP